MTESETHGSRTKLLLAFAAVYVLWGSTYLFIRWAVETLPPLGMAGVRFTIAGGVLYLWTRLRDGERPTPAMWRSSAIVGALLMASNAGVAFAEQRIPSGVASLLVGMTPCWFVLLDWLRPGGKKPGPGVVVGLVGGVAGVTILVGPGSMAGGEHFDTLGAAVVLIGSFAWAVGSIYSRHAPRPAMALQGSAMHMLCGGIILTIVSTVLGQYRDFSFAHVSLRSALAFLYLIVFGSLVGFSAFVYLLRATTPARVSTYAYVNPVVAVFLGWAFAGEELTFRVMLAALVIVGAVALITTFGGERRPPAKSPQRTAEAADEAVLEEVP
jgi:drug/metabolite transporter (DMT)-like permease